ncbi:DUF6549 family protein [Muribaculum intestinale]|uniref:DUF6549 family protein n=1 Tax=Muribaculum intestinale TaxID=1796646 RepID=UPI003F665EEE
MKKYLLIAIVALLAIAGSAIHYSQQLKADNERLHSNQSALMADVELYKTKAGENAAKVQRLQLTASEFETQCADLKAEVEQLGIKAKRLQQVIASSSQTKVEVRTEVKDSIVYVPMQARLDTLKCFEFNDGWVRASGCIDTSGHFEGEFESNDSLLIVAHRVPKRFLFFRWGCKRVELDIKSSNPHTSITHAKFIEFSKK